MLGRYVANDAKDIAAIEATKFPAAVVATKAEDMKMTMKQRLGIYSELGKAKLSGLVVMTAGAGFLMAGGPISWGSFAAVSIGTSIAAASANSFNQAWEVERDAQMHRTCRRPLPSGRITKNHALTFGFTTAAASTAILAAGCSPTVAALGLANIGLYSLVYTPMKTTSELNTWVGSVVGAIPPVMGWAAATGTLLTPEAALTAATLFLWQMPHFFALSWRARKDYARGGYKMVPCADPTGARTSALTERYSWYLLPLPILASLTGSTSYMFAVEGTALNAYLIHLSRKFRQKPNNSTAQKVFLTSLWYLPVFLGFMVFHSENWLSPEEKKEHEKHIPKIWREALLDEPLLDEDYIRHAENGDSMSDFIVAKIRNVRAHLRDVCVHEYLWGESDGKRAGEENVFCPVNVAETTSDEVKLATTLSNHSRE